MSKKNILLITGGANFIGSNLVKHFLADERVSLARVFGDPPVANTKTWLSSNSLLGDIWDYETYLKVTGGIDKISHQATLGSVFVRWRIRCVLFLVIEPKVYFKDGLGLQLVLPPINNIP